MPNVITDKSAFYKFSPGEEKTQGIAYLLIEMFKIRRSINILNMHPEKASRKRVYTRLTQKEADQLIRVIRR